MDIGHEWTIGCEGTTGHEGMNRHEGTIGCEGSQSESLDVFTGQDPDTDSFERVLESSLMVGG